jgi:hypothetical protein
MPRRWSSLKTEVKVSIVALMVTAVLGVGTLVLTYLVNKPASNEADVAISAVDVNSTKNIDAEWTDPSTGDKSSDKREGSAIDINLFNSGTAPGLITSADATFRQARELQNCSATGGESSLQARYDIKVPVEPNRTNVPFTVSRPMRFVVESNKQERLALTIGPEEIGDASWPWFYEVDITLRQSSGKDLEIQTVFLLENAYEQWLLLLTRDTPPDSGSEEVECVRKEAALLQRAVRTQGLHSPELLDFNKGIQAYLASVPA